PVRQSTRSNGLAIPLESCDTCSKNLVVVLLGPNQIAQLHIAEQVEKRQLGDVVVPDQWTLRLLRGLRVIRQRRREWTLAHGEVLIESRHRAGMLRSGI